MKNQDFRKGAWTREEDSLLRRCIEIHGEGKWNLVSKRAGLNRCRKSCRLRWMNYLDPNVNHEKLKEDEIELVIRMHRLLGNRWSMIAGRIPGRTANDIKNYWNTYLKKTLESQPKDEDEPNPTKKHQVVRPLPRFLTRVIAAGGSSSFIVPENLQHEHPPPPSLLLPEQKDDPAIQNNEHTIWWNDTLKLLELEGDENPNQSSGITNAGTGIKGSEIAMFDDIDFEWDNLLKNI